MKTFYSSILLIYTKQAVKNTPAIFITQQAAAGSFGEESCQRHSVAVIADACNIANSTTGVSTRIHIPFSSQYRKMISPVHLQFFQRGIIGKVSSSPCATGIPSGVEGYLALPF
ncbi:MAG: hypothetical protein IPP96_14035 [Chitinophagaceae bacterium]|nr:hypothetical protein [Chitinophagaceae bacterium]